VPTVPPGKVAGEIMSGGVVAGGATIVTDTVEDASGLGSVVFALVSVLPALPFPVTLAPTVESVAVLAVLVAMLSACATVNPSEPVIAGTKALPIKRISNPITVIFFSLFNLFISVCMLVFSTL
jgi:hypothetical protein